MKDFEPIREFVCNYVLEVSASKKGYLSWPSEAKNLFTNHLAAAFKEMRAKGRMRTKAYDEGLRIGCLEWALWQMHDIPGERVVTLSERTAQAFMGRVVKNGSAINGKVSNKLCQIAPHLPKPSWSSGRGFRFSRKPTLRSGDF